MGGSSRETWSTGLRCYQARSGHSGTKRGPGVAETETLIRIIAIATCELMNLVCLTYADFGTLDQIGELSAAELYKMTEQVVKLGYLNAA